MSKTVAYPGGLVEKKKAGPSTASSTPVWVSSLGLSLPRDLLAGYPFQLFQKTTWSVHVLHPTHAGRQFMAVLQPPQFDGGG